MDESRLILMVYDFSRRSDGEHNGYKLQTLQQCLPKDVSTVLIRGTPLDLWALLTDGRLERLSATNAREHDLGFFLEIYKSPYLLWSEDGRVYINLPMLRKEDEDSQASNFIYELLIGKKTFSSMYERFVK